MQSSELEFVFPNENEEDYKMITGNNKFEISDTILKLEELLDQGQFELMSDQVIDGKLKAVYLMNDAVESFLVFEQARITGVYQKEYEGEVEASLSIHKNPDTEKEEFVLVVYQGDTVCTLFFADIVLETHLYDYGKVGHFWVEGYEYLRQLEYRLAILRDKRDYLGEVYCNEAELKLAHLAEFPPLNYCCYPAVPEKYIVPKENPWIPSENAIRVMMGLAKQTEDKSLQRILSFYKRYFWKWVTRWIADMLHKNVHAEVVDLLTEELTKAASDYPERKFDEKEEKEHRTLLERAKQEQRKLKEQGIKADIVREEPFITSRDSLRYKVYLMEWRSKRGNRIVKIKEINN